MKPRYIDAVKLMDDAVITRSYKGESCVPVDCIDDAPTEDVAPVVHGHWYFTEYEYFTCSVCGKSYYNGCESSAEARSRLDKGDVFDFCPHCGAKMDEEDQCGG